MKGCQNPPKISADSGLRILIFEINELMVGQKTKKGYMATLNKKN